MSTLNWGLLRLELANGEAFHANRRLPLEAGDVALLGMLMRHPGEFVPEDTLPANDVLTPRVEVINEVLARHCGKSCYVMFLPQSGWGLALPGLALSPPSSKPLAGSATTLPRLRTRVVGQRDAVESLVGKLPDARLLTLVGPGGIGKTTLAVTVAAQLAGHYRDGVVFIDLSPLTGADTVPSALAAALHMPAVTGIGVQDLVVFLRGRQLLLVLDNCEHVVSAVADVSEAIYRHLVGTHVLVTSREPLRCMGESVHRLQSLPVPGESEARGAAEALGFASVQLLVERIADRQPGFALRDEDAALAASICRRVDGLPLAIELVAALADRLDLQTLASRLIEAPLRLQNERRPLAPRHQSLQDLLSWSYELLTAPECRMFQRLALFRARFTMASGGAVAADEGADAHQTHGLMIALATKSLVIAEPGQGGASFRFLDTTRAFALEKLIASGEHAHIARRHALHMCELFKDAEARWTSMTRADWLRIYGLLIDDVRSALAWCFSPEGDPHIGLALTVASTPLAYHLSLWDEYLARHEQAISRIDSMVDVDPIVELKLRTAHGTLLGQIHGPSEAMNESYRAALRLAKQAGAVRFAADALDGVWMGSYLSGDYPIALEIARECRGMTRDSFTDPAADTRTARMLAQSLHHTGNHDEALGLLDHLIKVPRPTTRRMAEGSIDPQVSSRVMASRIHWIQGRADAAEQVIVEALTIAESDISASVAQVLSWSAVSIALWRGDVALAQARLDRLAAHCADYQLPYWGTWVGVYKVAIAHASGGGAAGDGQDFRKDLKQLDMLATLAPRTVTPALVARAKGGMAPWCAAEVLRAYGEVLRAQSAADANAEEVFESGLALARQQGALAWELRCATSLARLWHGRGDRALAAGLLEPVLARFREGTGTRDLRVARALLDAS